MIIYYATSSKCWVTEDCSLLEWYQASGLRQYDLEPREFDDEDCRYNEELS